MERRLITPTHGPWIIQHPRDDVDSEPSRDRFNSNTSSRGEISPVQLPRIGLCRHSASLSTVQSCRGRRQPKRNMRSDRGRNNPMDRNLPGQLTGRSESSRLTIVSGLVGTYRGTTEADLVSVRVTENRFPNTVPIGEAVNWFDAASANRRDSLLEVV